MSEYTITWEIDLDADSHEEAAVKALIIQRDPESSATVFTARNRETGSIRTIDLDTDYE